MGGLGPVTGQSNTFRLYAAEKIPYAIERSANEVNRLFGVMNRQLADCEFLAGPPVLDGGHCLCQLDHKQEAMRTGYLRLPPSGALA
jgi:glutathione S-transferase